MTKASTGYVLRRLWPYLRRQTPALAASLLLAVLSVLTTLYSPILFGRAIDAIVGPGQVKLEQILPLLAEAAVLAVVAAGSNWLMTLLNNRLAFTLVKRLREDAFLKLQELPLSYLDSHPTGDTVSRLIADADQLTDGLLMGFAQLFSGVVTIVGTLVFMLLLDVGIALVVVMVTPLSLLVARFISQRTYRLFREQSEIRGAQTAFLEEMVTQQKVVKAFAHEEENQRVFDGLNEKLEKSSLKASFFSSLTNPSTRFINGLVYAGVGLFGALAALSGGITVGGLSCFLSYANQYTKPFNEISGVIAELQGAFACAARVFALMDAPSQRPDRPTDRELTSVAGKVAFDRVSFAYQPDRPLLQNISFTAAPGRRFAIVGPTGCGKTTLINLLLRFYEADGGTITVDGIPIDTITRRSLRRQYGMVLQDTWLRTGTVRENITMGRPEATDEEVVAAAKAARAHGFIHRLPQGYDTPLGEDGGPLSQGQKQLLCIARVMLCCPPMLILDEATSSIDTRTEMEVQRAFTALMEGKTCFVVAHRLSTIREADCILVMRDGNVVEMGTHEALMQRQGFYAQLYNSQFAG